jgi:RNA-directed DNA polymerase
VFEADIEACFDTIDHTALLGRVRRRIEDRRLLTLVKAFLKAGIMTEAGQREGTITGTPQGGILSPLLANIALSALDEHFDAKWKALGPEWKRVKHRRNGGAVHRLVRYADLCRRRHKSAYAEGRIMPSGGRDASSEAGIGSRSSA